MTQKSGAGALFISAKTGQALFSLRAPYKTHKLTWALWGGMIDGEETPKEALFRELEEEMGSTGERLAEMEELRARARSYESGDKARELERIKTELERTTANHERMTADHADNKVKLTKAQDTIDGYMGLMDSTEKTKAYLMVEEHGEMAIREIARSLGVAPAIVMKWAEEFQTLGIAWVIDGSTLVHRDSVEKKE